MHSGQERIPFHERRALKVSEAEDYSGLGKTKLYELARGGLIKSFKVGKCRLFDRASIDDLLASNIA
jgi:excisionase family DNA binding protein